MRGMGKFDRSALATLKLAPKRLGAAAFGPIRKKLPAPLDKLSHARRETTGMMEVANDLKVVFITKSGLAREEKSMYGFLFKDGAGRLIPLVRMDLHLSHKDLHILVNCEDERDLSGRSLPGCKELALERFAVSTFDPDREEDRQKFIATFCEVCNIALGRGDLF